jgi:hypothetical protein
VREDERKREKKKEKIERSEKRCVTRLSKGLAFAWSFWQPV